MKDYNYTDIDRSLYAFAEEFERLVNPFANQCNRVNQWEETLSPILRVARMNKEILSGAVAIDSMVAHRLREITEPYQQMLDNILATESNMVSRFSELVKPQIYVPSISRTEGLRTKSGSKDASTSLDCILYVFFRIYIAVKRTGKSLILHTFTSPPFCEYDRFIIEGW